MIESDGEFMGPSVWWRSQGKGQGQSETALSLAKGTDSTEARTGSDFTRPKSGGRRLLCLYSRYKTVRCHRSSVWSCVCV